MTVESNYAIAIATLSDWLRRPITSLTILGIELDSAELQVTSPAGKVH